jgi:transcriptional regulator with XRE-family HTH domain
MPINADVHIGKRLRRRRRILGMTQEELGNKVGVCFQQIQKYECGANRITASRLFALATALSVSISYFFDGLAPDGTLLPANDSFKNVSGDLFSQKETIELVRVFCKLNERVRRRLLNLAKDLGDDSQDTGRNTGTDD